MIKSHGQPYADVASLIASSAVYNEFRMSSLTSKAVVSAEENRIPQINTQARRVLVVIPGRTELQDSRVNVPIDRILL